MNFIKKKIAKPLKEAILGKSNSGDLRNPKLGRTNSDNTIPNTFSHNGSSPQQKSSFSRALYLKPNAWSAKYCTGVDEIDGFLTINEDSLVFTPSVNSGLQLRNSESPSNYAKEGQIRNFDAIINLHDVTDINLSVFPSFHMTDPKKKESIYILQISLSNHGDFQFEGEASTVINEVRNANKSYAAIFFNIQVEGNQEKSLSDRKAMFVGQIQQKIEAIKNPNLHHNKNSETVRTRLPYFEFIPNPFDKAHDKILRDAKQQIKENSLKIEKQQREASSRIKLNVSQTHFSFEESKSKPLVTNNTNLPVKKKKKIIQALVQDQSEIVDYGQLCQIMTCVPDFYQMMDWKLAYSNRKHGTSFNNLMRRCSEANPFVIIVKDFSGNIFGAYGSDKPRYTSGYYGSGETFVYTFKEQEIVQYNWSKKNDFFMFFNEDGLMFGTGPFYGLWISNDLTRGRTYACDTFDNEQLTSETDFEISRIEVWTVNNLLAF